MHASQKQGGPSKIQEQGAGAAIPCSMLLTCMQARFFVIKSVKETKPGIQGLRRTESTAVTEKCRTITHPKIKTVTVKETELLRRILGLENLKAKSTMVLGFSVLEFSRAVGAQRYEEMM